MPTIEMMIACPRCGGTVTTNTVECPQCGVVIARNRIRQESARPAGEVLSEETSDNLMGNYQIRKMDDGSLFCNCMSFLGQRGTRNGNGYATCKHINRYYEAHPDALITISEPVRPSDYQKAALKRLGVQNMDLVTNDQAYWIFKELLRKQGVSYKEYKFLMGQFNEISLLPVFSFGAEFELGINRTAGKEGLCRKMTEVGLETAFRGYTHDVMASWKVVTDSTVDVPDHEPLELVTPKLFGAEGFGKLRLALQTCNGIGSKVNSSCGLHVHVDAYWTEEEIFELAKFYLKIEQKIFWPLVPPSRRNNGYAKRMTRDGILEGMVSSDPRSNRYYSLNLKAFSQYKTVEFRIHSGTTDPERTINWIIFLLKTCDWVKKGGRSTQIELPSLTIGSYLDLIGMGNTSTSRLRRSREYIIERYNYWIQDAAMNPANIWVLDNANADDLVFNSPQRAQRVRRTQAQRATVTPPASQPAEPIFNDDEMNTATITGSFEERILNLAEFKFNRASLAETLPTTVLDGVIDYSQRNTVVYQASSYRPTRRIDFDHIRSSEILGTWFFASQSSGTMHNTTMTLPDDRNVIYGKMGCSCPGFRQRGFCVHTINVARYFVFKEYATRKVREVMAANGETPPSAHPQQSSQAEAESRDPITDQQRSLADFCYRRAPLSRPLDAARYRAEGEYDLDNLISVGFMAFHLHPTRRIPLNQITDCATSHEWRFVSESNPQLVHTTTLIMQDLSDNVLDAALNCTCRAWRRNRYCVHTINVARYFASLHYARRT